MLFAHAGRVIDVRRRYSSGVVSAELIAEAIVGVLLFGKVIARTIIYTAALIDFV